jgi:Flp pilus assembly protein TadD
MTNLQPRATLTPELVRGLLSGETQLRALFGLSRPQLAAMAAEGHQLWQQGRRQEALRIFRALIALDDRLYYGHAGLGLAAMCDENFAEAEQHLKTAAALEPNDASVASNLGEVLLRLDRLEDAIRELNRAASLDATGRNPGAARARAILQGIAHGVAGQIETGVEVKK